MGEGLGQTFGSVIVGRVRELGELRAGLAEVVHGGGRLFLVTGEPGIGKTRLADELAARAQEVGALALWGRCWEAGGGPAYWPWTQIVRSCVERADAETLRTDLSGSGALVAQVAPVVAERAGPFPQAPRLDAEHLRFAVFDATATYLRRVAAEVPLVLMLDDLHAADPSSLMLLQFLARGLRGSSILVVGTYRDADAGHQPHVAGMLAGLAREGTHVPLGGLDEADVSRLVDDIAGHAADRPRVRAIHRMSGGNPFFACELVRLLIVEGRLDGPPAGDGRIGIPVGVREAIAQRLALLSADAQRLLETASVVGREFDLRVLERVLGYPAARLLAAVEEARAAQLLIDHPRSSERYGFSHELVRETLAAGVAAGARAALHRAVGEALEALHQGPGAPPLAELAHHFYAAARSGTALKALDYASRAGDHAAGSAAYAEAAAHYESALECMSLARLGDERRLCGLQLELAEARWRGGDTAAAASFLEAAAVARQIGAPELLARCALGYARGLSGFLHVVRADANIIALLEEALTALGEGDSALRVRVLARLAVELYYSDQVDRRLGLSSDAVRIARRLGDPSCLLVALLSRHWAACGPETLAERLENATEMVRIGNELGDKEATFLGRHARLHCLLEVCDGAGVDRELAAIAELAADLREPFYVWRTLCLQGTRAILDARFADAERLMREAVAAGATAAEEIVTVVHQAAQTFARAWALGTLGELEGSMLGFTRRYPWIQPWRLPFLYAELGRRDDARAELDRQASAGFGDFPRDALWITRVGALAHACCLVGDTTRAAQLYDLLRPYADRNISTIADQSYGPVATRLGMLAALLGRWEDAERHFIAGHELCERLQAPMFAALNLAEHARMLLARGAHDDQAHAVELLSRARRLCDRHGIVGIDPRVTELEARSAVAEERVFRREGEYWTALYGGRAIRVRDGKGVRYLAELLLHPHQELHVLQLAAAVAGEPGGGDRGELATAADDGLPALDEAARADYRRRLSELDQEREQAHAFHDPELCASLDAEKEALLGELRSALGLGGRIRAKASASERARVNLTRAIRSTIERVSVDAPQLGEHLRASVKTGTYCVYRPDRTSARPWTR